MIRLDYSFWEKFLMMIFTSASNFWAIPGCIGVYQRGKYYHAFIGAMLITISTIYHFVDSFHIDNFLFDDGHWHRLDNMASAQGFISLIVYFLDLKDPDKEELYNLIGFLVTLVCQEGYPWQIEFTLLPLLPFFAMFIYKYFKTGFNITNRTALQRGRRYLLIAIIFFILGLDETKDYLRILHSIWHFFSALTFFYLFQSDYEKDKEIYYLEFIFPGKKLKYL